MSLIKCPECGHEISDSAASCPQCGYPISNPTAHPSIVSVAGQPNTTPSGKKRAVLTIVLISMLIVALAGWAAWYLFFQGGTDEDERAAYDSIMRYENQHQLDSLGAALDDYFDTYNSDAYHYSQLKDLHDRFFTEKADWQAIEGTLSLETVQHFMDVHPDGFYLKDANQMLDSLSYLAACDVNTREAYDHYLSQFSQGKYVAEVRKLMVELDNKELSAEENTAIKEVLTAHFEALGDDDKEGVAATLASEISSYIGKANPELEDIYTYMSHMHSSGRSIVFNVTKSIVTKIEAAGRNLYNVQFALDEEVYTHGHHAALDTETGNPEEKGEDAPAEVKHFKGAAVLNESMKITSLVLR